MQKVNWKNFSNVCPKSDSFIEGGDDDTFEWPEQTLLIKYSWTNGGIYYSDKYGIWNLERPSIIMNRLQIVCTR